MIRLSPEHRESLVNTPISLDGEPAHFQSASDDQAVIVADDGTNQITVSWLRASRIVEQGGDFLSSHES